MASRKSASLPLTSSPWRGGRRRRARIRRRPNQVLRGTDETGQPTPLLTARRHPRAVIDNARATHVCLDAMRALSRHPAHPRFKSPPGRDALPVVETKSRRSPVEKTENWQSRPGDSILQLPREEEPRHRQQSESDADTEDHERDFPPPLRRPALTGGAATDEIGKKLPALAATSDFRGLRHGQADCTANPLPADAPAKVGEVFNLARRDTGEGGQPASRRA